MTVAKYPMIFTCFMHLLWKLPKNDIDHRLHLSRSIAAVLTENLHVGFAQRASVSPLLEMYVVV